MPPDPEPPKNPDPTLIVEPTVVAPQLAQSAADQSSESRRSRRAFPDHLLPDPASAAVSAQEQGRGVGRRQRTRRRSWRRRRLRRRHIPRRRRRQRADGHSHALSRSIPKKRARRDIRARSFSKRSSGKTARCDIVRVVRSLGFGLDENAIEALKQWRFRPGMQKWRAGRCFAEYRSQFQPAVTKRTNGRG